MEVEIQSTTDYASEMATRMQTKEYGDVFLIPDALTDPAIYENYMLPLGTIDELSSKYRKEYLGDRSNNGVVYGLANLCLVRGIVYNKRIFREAGITSLPTTPEEFITDLKAIKEKTAAIPYYTNAVAGWTFDQWEDHVFGTFTGNTEFKNNVLPFKSDEFLPGTPHYEMSKIFYDIVREGLSEKDPTTCDWEASKGMLNRGEIACMVLGNWAIPQIQGADVHSEDVGYMPFPYTVNGKKYAGAGVDYCYAINKNTKYPAAARAWIDFLVDESGWALKEGGISLLTSDPMPQGLEAFADYTFVVNSAPSAKNNGALDEIQHESGITLYDNGARMNHIIDIVRGASGDTFEGYMASLNKAWSAATGKVAAAHR